jgi:hypothetical protein
MIEFLQILYKAKFKKNQANPIEWFDTNDDKPRAIVQISPAAQPNGVLVNYGDVLMYWVAQQELEKRGFSVMCLPREKADCERLKAQGAKLFLDCGGFIYSGSHHKALRSAQAASITAHNASWCKAGGAIAISAPQTFGPFPSNPEEDLNLQVKEMLNQFDLIYGRDPISVENLRQIDPDVDSKNLFEKFSEPFTPYRFWLIEVKMVKPILLKDLGRLFKQVLSWGGLFILTGF